MTHLTIKQSLLKLALASALVTFGSQAHAILKLDPTDIDGIVATEGELRDCTSCDANPNTTTNRDTWVFTGTANNDGDFYNDFVGVANPLTLLYKAEDSTELGLAEFVNAYSTSRNVLRGNGVSDADLFRESGPGVDLSLFSGLWLEVKDGNRDPSTYLFDIDDWNGIETIEMRNFFPGAEDAISHVSIWGYNAVDVPEPASLALLGLGLAGLGLIRRRRVD